MKLTGLKTIVAHYTVFLYLLLSSVQGESEIPYELSEIVVTATREESLISETPLAVTAIDSEILHTGSIVDIQDLENYVPGLEFANSISGNGALLNLRGIGVDSSLIVADPGVALYRDDVYYSTPVHSLFQFFDVDRIEVLRGPQGTLYGRNTLGGAVKVFNRVPEFLTTNEDESALSLSSGYVDVQGGDFDRLRLEGAATILMREIRLAHRLSFLREDRDGYVDNLTPGSPDLDDRNDTFLRWQSRYQPIESLDFLLSYNYWKQNDRAIARIPFGPRVSTSAIPSPFDYTGELPLPNDVRKVHLSDVQKRENDAHSVNFSWELDHSSWKLKSISSYQAADLSSQFDSDYTQLDLLDFYDSENTDAVTQEFQLTLGDLDDRWHTVAGLFFYTDDREQLLVLPANTILGPTALTVNATQETDAYAVFQETSYRFVEPLTLRLGFRYSYDEKESRQDFKNFFAPTPNRFNLEDDWDSLDYKLGLDWRISENDFVYFSITTGFRAGGFTFADPSSQPNAYDPEKITAYEIGYKGSRLDRRLQVALSTYYYDNRDIQSSQAVSGGGTTVGVVTSSSDATVYGLELETEFFLQSFWHIGLSAACTHATYATFENFVYELDPTFTPVSLAGNHLVRAPEYTVNLTNIFEVEIGQGSLQWFTRIYWSDETELNVFNDPRFRQNSFYLVDMSLRYSLFGNRWFIAAFVKNLGDEDIAVGFDEGLFGVDNHNSFLYAPPRTWGASVKYVF